MFYAITQTENFHHLKEIIIIIPAKNSDDALKFFMSEFGGLLGTLYFAHEVKINPIKQES